MLVKWSKENTLPFLVSKHTYTATVEIRMVVSQEAGIDLLQVPTIPFVSMYPRDASSLHRDTHLTVFNTSLFIIPRN